MGKISCCSVSLLMLGMLTMISCKPQVQQISATATEVVVQPTATTPQPSSFPTVESSIMPHDITKTPTIDIQNSAIINNEDVTCLPVKNVSSSKEASILKTGSILTRIHGEPGLWALSSNEDPKKIYPLFEVFSLSPDRKRLAFFSNGEESYLHVYDLATSDELKFPLQDDWGGIKRWEDDNRILLWLSEEKIEGKGRFTQSILLNLETGEAEVIDKEFNLPGYFYSFNAVPGYAFESHSPLNYSLVLYTGLEPGKKGDIYMLRDTEQNQELWRKEDIGIGFHAWPAWTNDGRYALLVLPRTQNKPYLEIIKVSQDGQQEESLVRLESLGEFDQNFDINYVEWSSDSNFVFFSIFKSGNLLETGPGFILNIETGELNEICENGFIQGWWIPSNQLLYIIENENKERVLKILDVDSQQAQSLLTMAEVFNRFDVIGWTPIEFQ